MKENKKNAKKQNLTIILLSSIIVLLLAICIYWLLIRNNNGEGSSNLYRIIDGSSYMVYSYFDEKYDLFDDNVQLSYPEFSGNDNSIQTLNNRIKEIFNGTKEKYENDYKKDHQSFCTFCIKKNNEYYCNDEMTNPKYVINETDKYLTVRISYFVGPACSSGYSEIKYYTIDKNKMEVLKDEDILQIFKLNNNEIDELLSAYIKNNHIEPTVDTSKIGDSLKNKNYFIYKDKLYINYMVYDEISYYETLVYDNNTLKQVDSEFKNIFEK